MIILERDNTLISLTNRNTILKEAKTDQGVIELKNSARFLQALDYTGFAPHPINISNDSIEMEYIVADKVPDDTLEKYALRVRINAIRAMLTFQKRNICHTRISDNIILRSGVPVLVGWSNARFLWESSPSATTLDADEFYPSLFNYVDDNLQIMRRWLIMRAHMRRWRGFGILHDYGTACGDFVALAASEGLYGVGYDNCIGNSSCIDVAKLRWSEFNGCNFWHSNILNVTTYSSNIALLLQTWSYILRDYGKLVADDLLYNIIKNSEALFFEETLYNSSLFTSNNDVYEYLRRMGKPVLMLSNSVKPDRHAIFKVGS